MLMNSSAPVLLRSHKLLCVASVISVVISLCRKVRPIVSDGYNKLSEVWRYLENQHKKVDTLFIPLRPQLGCKLHTSRPGNEALVSTVTASQNKGG